MNSQETKTETKFYADDCGDSSCDCCARDREATKKMWREFFKKKINTPPPINDFCYCYRGDDGEYPCVCEKSETPKKITKIVERVESPPDTPKHPSDLMNGFFTGYKNDAPCDGFDLKNDDKFW